MNSASQGEASYFGLGSVPALAGRAKRAEHDNEKEEHTRNRKQADLSAVDWGKLEQDVFAEIERRRFPPTLGCGERPPAMLSETEKIIKAFLAEVAEAAEAGVKITTLSGLGGKRRKRRIAAAAIARRFN